MTAAGRDGADREKVEVRVEVFVDQLEDLDALAGDLAGGDRSELLRRVLDDWRAERAQRFVWNGPGEPGGPDFHLR